MKRAYLSCFTTIALIASLNSVAEETTVVEPTPDVNNCRVTFLPETGELFLPCVDVLNANGQVDSYRVVLNQNSNSFQLSHYEQLLSNQTNLRAAFSIGTKAVKWVWNSKLGQWILTNVLYDGSKWVISSIWDSKSGRWVSSRGCTLTSGGSTVTGLGCK